LKTVTFKTELGINKGYDNQKNDTVSYNIIDVGSVLQNIAKKHFEITGLYVSTVINGPNKTIYNEDWGCPIGGETTYTISGIANPTFTPDFNEYKKAVLMVVFDTKKYFEQSTLSVEFNSENGIDFYYLTDDKSLQSAIDEIDRESFTDKNIEDNILL
jgi:hypothetical protein